MALALAITTDLVAITVLAYALYFRRHRRRDLLLSYVALNIGVVAVTLALSSVEVGIGLGIGLFGILSIIRLRSDQITQQEIAYYFTALALGLLAGLNPTPMWVTPALSALILLVMFVLDSPRVGRDTYRHILTLDRAFPRRAGLEAHLSELLSARILSLEVIEMDLVRDTTVVDVRYRAVAPVPTAEPAPSGYHSELPVGRSHQPAAYQPAEATAVTEPWAAMQR